MTRFEKEISGALGEFWQRSAQKEIEATQREFNEGKITVDANGILRNCIGRVAVKEVREKCRYIGIAFNAEETEKADKYETAASIAEYKAAQRNSKTSDEELYEMQAAFGKGAVVVDVITGKTYRL